MQLEQEKGSLKCSEHITHSHTLAVRSREHRDLSPALCRRLRSRLYTVVWGEEKDALAAEAAPSTAVLRRAAEEYEQEEEEQALEEV